MKLKPGMTANVSIIVAERNDALRIPNAALRYRPPESTTNTVARTAGAGGGSRSGGAAGTRPRGERRSARTVYVLKNNKPQPVPIKTGISDGIYTEVTEGLSENDKVVTSAIFKQGSTAPAQPTSPFGGGGIRRF